MSCGCTGRAKTLEEQASMAIEAELQHDRKIYNKTYRLLVLGPGESGKSTFIKQMKILHANGFTDEDRRSYISAIRDNIITAMKCITGAMSNLEPPVELANKENEESLLFIQMQGRRSVYDINEVDDEFVEHIIRLWEDAGVQACFRRSSEYLLYDSAEYFLSKVREVYSKDFLPSEQDILRCRIITTGIFETKFELQGVYFHFFDVGGQREERRKWIQCFSDATVILYVASSSCYDMVLREDDTQNQLKESTELLSSLWNNRFLRYLSVILFLNKQDQLQQKVETHGTASLLKNFPEFADFTPTNPNSTDLEKVKDFLLTKFLAATEDEENEEDGARRRHSTSGRQVYHHFTTAVDTANIKRVFDDTKNMIRRIVIDEMSGRKETFTNEHWLDRNLKRKRNAAPRSGSTGADDTSNLLE